jgi:hypothetical protein
MNYLYLYLVSALCLLQIDLEPDEYITIETNQRIGLTTTGDQDKPISLRQIFNESFAQILSSNLVGPFQLQQPYQFGNIPYPGLFLLDFCDDSGRWMFSQVHSEIKKLLIQQVSRL